LISSGKNEKGGCRSVRLVGPAFVAGLLHDLAADFATWIGRGVDVHVVFAGEQIGGLRIG
jgi:hypothetical protein